MRAAVKQIAYRAAAAQLKQLDEALLLRWVKAQEQVRIAEEQQAMMDRGAAMPFLVRSATGGQLLSPYLAVIWRETDVMIRLSDRLGFSPVARPRIQIEPAKPCEPVADNDTWALLKRFPAIEGGKGKAAASPRGRRRRDDGGQA